MGPFGETEEVISEIEGDVEDPEGGYSPFMRPQAGQARTSPPRDDVGVTV